ncbi:MAG: response regulator [Sphingobacterium sp.]
MGEIRILLTEDHLVVRNGIKLLLESISDFVVVAEAGCGRETLDLLSSDLETDIVMTDLNMANMDGFELLEQITEKHPNIKVVVLTMLNSEQHVLKAFAAGAKGYLVKNVSAEEMIFAIQHISRGGRYLCEEMSMLFVEKLIDKNRTDSQILDPVEIDLSPREMEVLELLGEGLTNLEISKKLFLSKRTVEGHRQNLIEKTRAKNTPALIKFAVQHGLIS